MYNLEHYYFVKPFQQLALLNRLVLNSQMFASFCLPSAGINTLKYQHLAQVILLLLQDLNEEHGSKKSLHSD